MASIESYSLHPVGIVRSELRERRDAPKQGNEGAPEAWLEIYPNYLEAIEGIAPGMELLVLTWLHLGRREVLKVHPRDNPDRTLTGVFLTRSPDRPNPIGLHRVTVVEIDGAGRLLVHPLEAVDGTPVIDIKAVLCAPAKA